MKEKTILMDEMAQNRALYRISHEIIEKNKGAENLVLLGIRTRGIPMAERLKNNIYNIENVSVPMDTIDITLYRDDLSEIASAPYSSGEPLKVEVKGKNVVLCDDVLYTGRTVRAAIEAVLKAGRPQSIQLAVLIDRGHRELPIRADYVGKNIPTSISEVVAVRFKEVDGENIVKLYDK